jgi:peptidase M48-like protein
MVASPLSGKVPRSARGDVVSASRVRAIACVAVIAAAVGLIQLPVRGQTVSNMYDAAKVAREKARLESRITEIYVKAFSPALTTDERRALSGVRVQTPLEGDPVLGYYSDSKSRIVTMPAISLLFFEDLCIAYAWLQVRGYRLETVEEYVTMLKYKDARAFGGRYPSPLDALGIPADAASDPRVNDLSLRFRNSGYAFILGHELGHIRYQHAGYDGVPVAESQAHEIQADQFGLDLMRRTSTIPMGAMIFFQSTVYYFENRADFSSDAAWRAHLAARATHPLSTDRLQSLSKAISASADDFARGQPDRASAIETVRFIGDRFAVFAAFLSDPVLQRAMRAKAEQASPAFLRPRR